MDEGSRKRNIENYMKLANTINHNFNAKQKSTLVWADIFEAVKHSSIGNFIEEKEIRSQLNDLVKIMPDWICLMSLPGKTLVRQIKKISDYELNELIKLHFST